MVYQGRLRVSQRRYRSHGLARLVKGIPAEIQKPWLSKVSWGYPSWVTLYALDGGVCVNYRVLLRRYGYGLVIEGAWSIVSQWRYSYDRTGWGIGVEKLKKQDKTTLVGVKRYTREDFWMVWVSQRRYVGYDGGIMVKNFVITHLESNSCWSASHFYL